MEKRGLNIWRKKLTHAFVSSGHIEAALEKGFIHKIRNKWPIFYNEAFLIAIFKPKCNSLQMFLPLPIHKDICCKFQCEFNWTRKKCDVRVTFTPMGQNLRKGLASSSPSLYSSHVWLYLNFNFFNFFFKSEKRARKLFPLAVLLTILVKQY